MGTSWMAGGLPLGFSVSILPPTKLAEVFAFVGPARAGEPVKTAGDTPISDSSLRRLIFIGTAPSFDDRFAHCAFAHKRRVIRLICMQFGYGKANTYIALCPVGVRISGTSALNSGTSR